MRITAEVDVDVGDILEDIDTRTILAELERRAARGDVMAGGAIVGRDRFGLGDWDAESLVEAVRVNDGRRCLDLLRLVVL